MQAKAAQEMAEHQQRAQAAHAHRVAGNDEAGTNEESFEVGMRQNAMEFDAHDLDRNHALDFTEFSSLVRERELGVHSEMALRARFAQLDPMGRGVVSMQSYIVWSLKEALSRGASRVIDLFIEWDADSDGSLSKREFRRALRAFGFR
jgi:Ca2+-binding EF-hand superfamily protein